MILNYGGIHRKKSECRLLMSVLACVYKNAVSWHKYRLKVCAHMRCFTVPSLRMILIPAQLKGDTLAILVCVPSALSCLQKKLLICLPDRSF